MRRWSHSSRDTRQIRVDSVRRQSNEINYNIRVGKWRKSKSRELSMKPSLWTFPFSVAFLVWFQVTFVAVDVGSFLISIYHSLYRRNDLNVASFLHSPPTPWRRHRHVQHTPFNEIQFSAFCAVAAANIFHFIFHSLPSPQPCVWSFNSPRETTRIVEQQSSLIIAAFTRGGIQPAC